MQEYSAGLSTKRPDQEEKAGAILAPILAAQAGFLMSHHLREKWNRAYKNFQVIQIYSIVTSFSKKGLLSQSDMNI